MGESEDETFVRLNKALRIKNAKIEVSVIVERSRVDRVVGAKVGL